jgi:tetratricopeptide (TPR) repeat protein
MLTMPAPSSTPRPKASSAFVRKSVGRAHLHANRLEEALDVFADLIRQYPGDAEAHWLLGDCYLAGGDAATALQLYRRAQVIEPGNTEISRRLLLAQGERGEQTAEPVPTDPEAIARLLQRLTGRRAPVTKAEVARAAHILSEIVNSPRPAIEVSKRLNEIDELLPALLELNIRQARADGRPDVAAALEHLSNNIALQKHVQ